MDLEDALCSKVSIKILRLLLAGGQLNASEIVERVGGNYNAVFKHLEVLESEGILSVVPFGKRIRYYKFNEQSPRARAVQALFQAWKS